MSSGHSSNKYEQPVIIFLSLLLAGLSFLLPVAPSVTDAFAAHLRTAVGIIIATFYIGAAILFLRGLTGFKTGLRVAYTLLAIGIIIFSLAILQLPVFGLFDLWKTPYVDSGGAILPFCVGLLVVYIGMRKFARVLGTHALFASFLFSFALTAIVVALVFVAAQNWVQYELEGVDIYIAAVSFAASYGLIAGILAHKIGKAIGTYYRPAMRALKIGLLATGLGASHEFLTTFYVNNGHWYNDSGLYLLVFVISGFLVLRAGQEFRLLAVRIVSGEPEAAHALEATDRDYLDSITEVASLASRLEDVDSILDDMRMVTSHGKPGAGLSAEDKKRLLQVFYELETHLMTKDTLRNFTKEEVREQATPAFRALIEKKADAK